MWVHIRILIFSTAYMWKVLLFLVNVVSDRKARLGTYVSLTGGLLETLFGLSYFRWLPVLLYLGLLVIIGSVMTLKPAYSRVGGFIGAGFSVFFLGYWFWVTRELPTPLLLWLVGLIGSIFAVIGGVISILKKGPSV